ncbi:MAG: GNAT family N-acetyltransferase [Propionibacteriaceae bacterium]|jgi:ribosomal-protein-alanine N-acetyltransferase|nr:GNAT family N-acetyltransferase [Propionibacteriaceae bacterium]
MDLEQSGFTAQRWSATSWAGEIGRPGHLVLVGRQATGLVAAAAWSVLAGAAELLRLVVDPAQRRLGWGRRLVEAGLDWAALNRAEAAFLEVSEDNQAAVDLYAAEGFVALDRRRDYYAPGRHAVVMRRPLAGPSQGGSGV